MSETKCKMFESKLTNGQLICINKMVEQKRLLGSKEQIVLEATNGRTSEVKELFVNEATEVIRFLKNAKSGFIYETVV